MARTLRTNIGEFNLMTLSENPNNVACPETFLDSTVAKGECKIFWYSQWERKKNDNGQTGGVAVCFKGISTFVFFFQCFLTSLQYFFFKIIIATKQSILLSVLYRHRLDFYTHLDNLTLHYNCSSVILMADRNQNLVQNAFDGFIAAHSRRLAYKRIGFIPGPSRI